MLMPPVSVAYPDIEPTGIPHVTMNTRIAQQVGASFGTAIVAAALRALLDRGATGAFQGCVLVGDRHRRRRGRTGHRAAGQEVQCELT
ncbi:MAG TPA: hypothetical protein VFX16_17030 [Pseudonocardiaceae bacterium]|nr:hypothetical protein [Pseudonocardiaceae bacterium]